MFDRFAVELLAGYEKQADVSVTFSEAMIDHFRLDRSDKAALRTKLSELSENMSDADSDALTEQLKAKGYEVDFNIAQIDPAVFRTWQPEFGEDPRYWQLLSWAEQCVLWDTDGEFLGFMDFRPEFYEPLVEAKLKGRADACTLLSLLPVYVVAADDYVEHTLQSEAEAKQRKLDEIASAQAEGDPEPDPDDPDEYHSEAELATLRKLAVGMVARLGVPSSEALWDLAVTTNPEWAQVYYARADVYARQGKYDLALEDMHRGNTAPRNEEMVSFPMSFANELIAQGKVPGNKQLLGLMGIANPTAGITSSSAYPSQIGWRHSETFPTLEREMQLQLFAAALKEALRNTRVDRDFQLVSSRVMPFRQLLRGADEFLGPLLDEQSQQELRVHIESVGAVNEQLSEAWLASINGPSPAYWDMGPYPLTPAEFLEWLRPMHEHWYEDAVKNQATYTDEVVPLLDRLEQFDMASLTFNDS